MPRQTTFMKAGETTRQWHHIDADGQVLGRLAAKVAPILMGKHRPEFTPHVDTGDMVVVTNAAKIMLTGRKGEQRMHMRYSGYPGGLNMRSTNDLLEKHPERVVEQAIRRTAFISQRGRVQSARLKICVHYKTICATLTLRPRPNLRKPAGVGTRPGKVSLRRRTRSPERLS